MDWVIQNWDDVIVVLFAVVGAASAIVKLTPTQKDDAVVGKILKVLDALALNPKNKK